MFEKRRLLPDNHRKNTSIKSFYRNKLSVHRSINPIEDFYKHSSVCAETGEECYEYFNDVYLILNQKRLDAMTLSDFQSTLNSDPSLSQLSQIRSKMSDEELHQFVKSRYIQHPAELLSWMYHLDYQLQKTIENLTPPDSVQQDSVQQVSSEPVQSAQPDSAQPAVSV